MVPVVGALIICGTLRAIALPNMAPTNSIDVNNAIMNHVRSFIFSLR